MFAWRPYLELVLLGLSSSAGVEEIDSENLLRASVSIVNSRPSAPAALRGQVQRAEVQPLRNAIENHGPVRDFALGSSSCGFVLSVAVAFSSSSSHPCASPLSILILKGLVRIFGRRAHRFPIH